MLGPWKRIPFVSQVEGAECGAACLAMVLRYYGRFEPLSAVRDRCEVGRDGTSALSIARAARAYGLDVRPHRVGADALPKLPTPCILHWESHHFVVLAKCAKDGTASVVDPRHGRRRVLGPSVAKSFSGTALHLQPTSTFAKGGRSLRFAERVGPILRSSWTTLVPILFAVMLSELAGFVFPAALPFLFDHVLPGKQIPWLIGLGGTLVAVTFLRTAIAIARSRILNHLRAAVELRMSADLVARMLRLQRSFFLRRGSATVSATVRHLLALRDIVCDAILASFDAFLLLAYGFLIFLYDVRLATIVVVALGLRLGLSLFVKSSGEEHQANAVAASDRGYAALAGVLSGPELVKALRLEQRMESTIDSLRARELNARKTLAAGRALGGESIALFDAATLAVLLVFGGHAVIAGKLTVGVLYSFLAVELLLRRPATSVLDSIRELDALGPVVERLNEIDSTPMEAPGGVLAGVHGAIVADRVCVRLSATGPLVVDDVSLAIRPGEHVAIAGPSGSGKSTFLRSLVGLVPRTSGSVYVDSTSIDVLDLRALRPHVSLVACDGSFFTGTVRENLLLGRVVPEDRIRWALATACLDDVIRDLDAPLGPAGSTLSGGQRHRLLLARALLSLPRVLLLDELTSSLDQPLEEKIVGSLRALGITLVSVAHRESALRHADRIVLFEAGRVQGAGSFDELCQSSLTFRRLMKREVAR